jgi:hypothetical protein
VKSTSIQGQAGGWVPWVDVGGGLLGRTFTERRGVGRVGSKKSLDWANKLFMGWKPQGRRLRGTFGGSGHRSDSMFLGLVQSEEAQPSAGGWVCSPISLRLRVGFGVGCW